MSLWILIACTQPATPAKDEPTDTGSGDSGTDSGVPAMTVMAVSGYWGGDVHLYERDGAPLGVLSGVDGAQTVVLAPSGELVACAEVRNEILRFDAVNYAPLAPLVDADAAAAAGLAGPTAAVFGPDGNLYVASFDDDRVLRFGPDGTFVDTFVDSGAGGLHGPDIGMAFGPDGDLYVPGWSSASVHRYDAATGLSLGAVVGPEAGLVAPRGLAWDGDGRMYVSDNAANLVLRVDPTGAAETFYTQRRVTGLWFDDGELLVGSDRGDAVTAVDPATGASLGVLVPASDIDGTTAIGGWITPG